MPSFWVACHDNHAPFVEPFIHFLPTAVDRRQHRPGLLRRRAHGLCHTHAGMRERYSVVRIHGSHDSDTLRDDLFGAVCLLRELQQSATTVLCGDFNIDFAPELPQDPWARRPGRMQHHSRRRQLLRSFLDARRLSLRLPMSVQSVVGEGVSESDMTTADGHLTRRPQGMPVLTTLPSLIDYFAVTQATEFTATGTWLGAPADHCVLRRPLRRPQRPKRKWRCRHWGAATAWAASKAPEAMDLEGLLFFAVDVQERWEDARCCAERRADRYPCALRLLAIWAR